MRIGDRVDIWSNKALEYFSMKFPNAMEKISAQWSKSFEPFSNTSLCVVGFSTYMGVKLLGRACYNPRLSTAKRIASALGSLVFFGMVAYEIYHHKKIFISEKN